MTQPFMPKFRPSGAMGTGASNRDAASGSINFKLKTYFAAVLSQAQLSADFKQNSELQVGT